MPSLFIYKTATLDTLYDWNYTVVPQKGMHNQTFSYPHGRLLGGSSSVSECSRIQHLLEFIEYLRRLYGSPTNMARTRTGTGMLT